MAIQVDESQAEKLGGKEYGFDIFMQWQLIQTITNNYKLVGRSLVRFGLVGTEKARA